MKSKRVIVYSLIGIVLFSIVIFIGFKLKDESNKKTSNFEKILEVNRKLEKENELSGGFPYTLEFLDYNITINSVKVFEDYALFDYSVKKIDGGYINSTDVNITGNVKSVSIKEEVYLTDEDYLSLNKKITFDNVDFEIRSLSNFEFGSLLYIFVGNKDEEECKRIANQYSVKLISGDYERSFDLEKWVGFTELAIRKYSSIDERYNKDSKHDQFYMSRMFYNLNEVHRDNMEVYLINNRTKEEIRII